MALPLACAAILGRDNEPLYIRSFGEQSAHELLADQDNLKWHFYVHSSLDLIEQRVQKKDAAVGGASNGANMDPYLGLLCPIDEYRVFGYVSNTKVKYVAIIRDVNTREGEIKTFLRKLHALYVDTISSPFITVGARLDLDSFHAKVVKLIASFDAQFPQTVGQVAAAAAVAARA